MISLAEFNNMIGRPIIYINYTHLSLDLAFNLVCVNDLGHVSTPVALHVCHLLDLLKGVGCY